MNRLAQRMATAGLALRSTLWAVVMPGMVAGYLPWRYLGVRDAHLDPSNPVHIAAGVGIALGAALLIACIVEFARSGRGTLSPLDPPKQLVVRGLYRYVRNPMYLSVTTIVLGEALLTRSSRLLVYWMIFFAAANLFVIGYEEPFLRRTFGASYDAYTRQVGRWIPTLRPRAGGGA